MRALPFAVFACLLATNASGQGVPKLKPGAWEITSQHQGADLRGMEDMLAKMPPQVREMMQQKMQAGAGPTSTTLRHCATANDESFANQMQGRMGMDIQCENTGMRASGNTHTWMSRCTGKGIGGQPFRSEAEHTVILTGADGFEHRSTTRTDGGPGGASSSTNSSKGRYLGGDCKAHAALTLEERMKPLEGMPGAGRPRRQGQ